MKGAIVNKGIGSFANNSLTDDNIFVFDPEEGGITSVFTSLTDIPEQKDMKFIITDVLEYINSIGIVIKKGEIIVLETGIIINGYVTSGYVTSGYVSN